METLIFVINYAMIGWFAFLQGHAITDHLLPDWHVDLFIESLKITKV